MGKNREQVNIRVDETVNAMIDELIPAVSESLGIKVTLTDLFRLGLIELKKKYAVEPKKGKK